jgi:hypothetical protein
MKRMPLYDNFTHLKNTMYNHYMLLSMTDVLNRFIPLLRGNSVPSMLHIFLWLFANNKVLTRDNLSKRKHVDDVMCLFCAEAESVQHLFFECCIAKMMWCQLCEICNKVVGADFESVARLWLCDKKFKALNICTTAVLWFLWKMRNLLCFHGKKWCGMYDLYFMCAKMLRR